MKNLLVYCLIIFPLFISCQEYNNPPYDEWEAKLRFIPPKELKYVPIYGEWQKRDSLTYFRFKEVERASFAETDSIPAWITQFKNLKIIHGMGETNFKSIPENIGDLKKLEILSLEGNSIENIPPSIKELKNLKELHLSTNKLVVIPEELRDLKNLEMLLLMENQIQVLPEFICELINLKSLTLSKNPITSIPPCISKLKNLDYLGFSNMKLTNLPEEFYSLGNKKGGKLEQIYIGGNDLDKETIKKLKESIQTVNH